MDVKQLILEYGQQVLTVNPEDVENIRFATPRDVIVDADGTRSLGTARLHLHLTFKEGRAPTWMQRP